MPQSAVKKPAKVQHSLKLLPSHTKPISRRRLSNTFLEEGDFCSAIISVSKNTAKLVKSADEALDIRAVTHNLLDRSALILQRISFLSTMHLRLDTAAIYLPTL